ncbi:MAG: recombinase family protein [Thermoflexales bacterium]|nr:recombinase family protein [Thermoflexales bacterium]
MSSTQPPAPLGDELPDNILQTYYKLTGQRLQDSPGALSNTVRAANYIRLSKEGETVHSLDTQPDLSQKYIDGHGWQLVGTYADPDHTGRNSKRPELQRLLRDIKAGRMDVVVIHRLDRLYRNLEALLKFIRLLKRCRVRLVSVSENIDLDNDWGYLTIYVLGGLAEYYVRNLSRRTNEGKLTRVSKGLLNGNSRFGYCNGLCSECTDPNGGGPEAGSYCPRAGEANLGKGDVPVPHPIESIAVRLAFEWYAEGSVSDLDIATRFNDYDYTLPDGSTVHFRTKGGLGRSQPGPFSKDNVRDILTNVVYAGIAAHYPSRPLSWDDDDPPAMPDFSRLTPNRRVADFIKQGQHHPIVSWSMFEQCQIIRQRKGKNPNSNKRPARVYPLSGIAKCWHCSQQEHKDVSLRGIASNGDMRYYRCATIIDFHKRRSLERQAQDIPLPEQVKRATRNNPTNTTGCTTQSLRAERLEEQLDTIVQRLQIPAGWHERILAYYLSDDGMLEYERQRYNLVQSIKQSAFLLKSGVISQAEFIQDQARFTQRLSRLKPSANGETAMLDEWLDDFPALWQQMTMEQHKGLLQVMFTGAYFDGAQLVKVTANAPFGELLGLEDGKVGCERE